MFSDLLSFVPRDSTLSSIESSPRTFSSWHQCMQKAYCKWPAIIGIILGVILVLSLLTCLVRCTCMGLSCCCECLECLVCCPSLCRTGRGRRRDRGGRNTQQYFQPAPYYPPAAGYAPAPPPPSYGYNPYDNTPRYAQFDAPSPAKAPPHDDALPHMPSWDSSSHAHVPVSGGRDDDLEMGRMGANAPMLAPENAGYAGAASGGGGGGMGYPQGYAGARGYGYEQAAAGGGGGGGGGGAYAAPPSSHGNLSGTTVYELPSRPQQGSWRDV
ncbi:MAG: hypothetical protein M1819_002422 [Sarea resinae]|nr:MAG: hypothetical protein M1819_002422 [Sarea resinae]